MSYFDSAYIAKFYVDEADSDDVRRLAETLGRVYCCALGRVEVASVFHRKLREEAFTDREFREVLSQFQDDCASGLWTWLPIRDTLVANVAESFRALGKRTAVRAADMMHLVCAREHGVRRVYTNDRHMLGAASELGIEALKI